MTLINWPPSKGPKPPHLEVVDEYHVPKMKRTDFRFRQSPDSAAERRLLLEAVLEHHGNKGIEEHVGSMELPLPHKGRGRKDTQFTFHYPVSLVAGLSLEQAHVLLRGLGKKRRDLVRDLPLRSTSVDITYPLTVGVSLSIRPFTFTRREGKKVIEDEECMSIGYVLWAVALEYKRIYADWKLYRPWGHALEDLVFHKLQVGRKLLRIGVSS